MKQFSLLLSAFALSFQLLQAQTASLQNFIEKYKNDPAFTFGFVSKDMLETASKSDISEKDWKKIQNVVHDLGALTLLFSEGNAAAPALFKEAFAEVQTDGFDELLSVRDGKENVRVWVKDDTETLTDLVLLVGTTDEFVLVCFSGVLEFDNVAQLAKLLDADEVEDLAKTVAGSAIHFSVSPNPSAGEFVLHCSEANDFPKDLTISDGNGRVISTLNLTRETTQKIELRDLPNGIYWLQLRTEKGKFGTQQVQILRKN